MKFKKSSLNLFRNYSIIFFITLTCVISTDSYGQLKLDADPAHTMEHLYISVSSGINFISDVDIEDLEETFYDTKEKIGPCFSTRIGGRIGREYPGKRIYWLIAFSYNYSSFNGKSKREIWGYESGNYRAYKAKLEKLHVHTISGDLGLLTTIGKKKESSFELTIPFPVSFHIYKADILLANWDPWGNPNPVYTPADSYKANPGKIGWGFNMAFNFAVSKSVAIRWDIGYSYIFGRDDDLITFEAIDSRGSIDFDEWGAQYLITQLGLIVDFF